ncbi:MAG: serine/threonine protein kinase [Polyangiales bacterium]
MEVYVAREEGPLAREVTLRCVRRGERDAVRAAELLREAKICAHLNHPAIVRVLGFLEEGDRYVLVLEHVEGVSLASLLELLEARGDHLPFSACAYVASTIASALAAAHTHVEDGNAQPILHRALSPAVVHVADDGSVMLGGFGLGKILDQTPDSVAGFVRTSGQLAPEVVRGEPSTVRSDVFSLAALCYRLFAGGSDHKPVIEAIAGRSPSLASVRSDVPRELAAAIDAALEPDPAKRSIPAAEIARWIARITTLEEGQRVLRTIVESLPQEDVEGSHAPDRPKRRVRGIERASRARMEVLRRSTSDAREEIELEPASEEVPQVVQPAVVQPAPLPVEIAAPPAPVLIETGRTRTIVGVGDVAPQSYRPALATRSSQRSAVVLAEPPPPIAAPPVAGHEVAISPPPIALEAEPFAPRRRGPITALLAGGLLVVVGLVVLFVPRTKTAAKAEPAPETSESAPAKVAPPPISVSAKPAATASATAPASASTEEVPEPPKKKLPPDFGWLYVRSDTAGRVFVAGRGRGEPKQVLMVPCGKLYVNLAKVDAKGNWRGWATKGKMTNIPCNGTVGDVTLDGQ